MTALYFPQICNNNPNWKMEKNIRILELYSGIGGMHYAINCQ